MRFAILAIIIWTVIYFSMRSRIGFKGYDVLMNQLIKDEQKANSARKKDIEPHLYYTPDWAVLPQQEDSSGKRKRLLNCASRVMIRFPEKMTNIELKKAYGVSQLESISQYEENFQLYLAALIDWAEALLADGHKEDCLRILEYTLELGSEYRKSYKLTADLYAEAQDLDSLNALLAKAETFPFTDNGIKQGIVEHIMNKRIEADI